jgi:lipopolysaccharide biosynthesis regulator YciM
VVTGHPGLFGLGWVARASISASWCRNRARCRGYFKGLNFLLNEQPDKAIDAFIEIVRLDPESADMHFALGNLFRRRGETERAIRVHQNLLARPDLPQEQKEHAQYELGMDYLKAGLLDRAEETFNACSTASTRRRRARAAGDFPAREEWPRAIEAAIGLQESGAGSRQKEIAQFYCELAQDALVHLHPEEALALLEKSLQADRVNVRATMLTGDAQLAQGDVEGALLTWRRVEQISVPHVALVAQRLMDGYRKVGRRRKASTC